MFGIRIWIIAGLAAAVIGVGFWIYQQGRQASDLDRLEDEVETGERADDAATDAANRGVDWILERLRERFE